jgi:CheY-like chemotaxis protein
MKKILVIDDEYTILRVLERLGGQIGCQVTTCKTAEEGMTYLQGPIRYDLILTDIILPGVSGLEFLDWLKEKGFFNQKVVVMTAYPKTEFVDYALKQGALEVLTKPFDSLASLSIKLRSWISTLEIQPTPL